MKHILLTILMVVLAASNAAAQLKPVEALTDVQTMITSGDKLKVTDSKGEVIQGEVVGLTRTSLRVKTGRKIIEWQESDIREIQKRRHDSVWNGAVYGMLAGLAAGALLAYSACDHPDSECEAITGLIFVPAGLAGGLAAGALIDSSIHKFDTVFRAPGGSQRRSVHLTPILSSDRKGAALFFTF